MSIHTTTPLLIMMKAVRELQTEHTNRLLSGNVIPPMSDSEITDFLMERTAYAELYESLQALWNEVARYQNIGHEGSELLEVMSDARAALAKARGEST
jgi:hypothetical protein